METTTYTLQVDLDDTELATLKGAGYSLCVAKKVNNVYNVVWQGIPFLAKNTFQWTEAYAVYGQVDFTSGALVKADTNLMPIALGESTTLDTNGVFQDVQGAPGGASITIDNNYGTINLGVEAMIDDKFQPIYLDVLPAVTGTETLTPVVSVMVWFDRTLTTSTMFTTAVSRTLEIDYTGITSQTVSYVSDPKTNSGIWVYGDPTSGQGLQYSPHKLYHPLTGTFEDLPFADDRDVVRGLIDKYLSSSIGKAAPPPQYLVQATVTLPPTGDPKQAISFLRAFLPIAVTADFQIPTKQAAGPGKVFMAKLAWNALVPMKALTAGEDDVGKLEQLFKSSLDLYGPGYTSLNYVALKQTTEAGVARTPSPLN